jgi:molybdenum cofactor synthesis domain-containing protein
VVPRPRVGVFSTGDELVPAGEPLGPGQIRDSNRLALLALLADAGMEGVDLGLVRDDEQAITTAVETAVASCDAVATSGGVSMGDVDLVKVVLDRMGDLRWMQIAIRPAKPFAFGTVGPRAVPVFGLPGNPVSSMVSFELLAHPALRRMAGHERVHRPRLPAVAEEDFGRRPDGRTSFVRVACRRTDDGGLAVRSAGAQGSHHLTAMAKAHALLVLEDGPGVAAGDPVEVLLLHEP